MSGDIASLLALLAKRETLCMRHGTLGLCHFDHSHVPNHLVAEQVRHLEQLKAALRLCVIEIRSREAADKLGARVSTTAVGGLSVLQHAEKALAVAGDCATCLNTGLHPMYEGAEKDGNFWGKCDDCGRKAEPGARWPA